MLAIAFIRWWYGPGWKDCSNRIRTRLTHTYLEFSVPILVRTLFSPWRRIVTNGNGAIGQQLRAVVDNIVSRFVGFGVRLSALIAAIVAMGLTALFGGILLVIWPVLPVVGPLLIIIGLMV